MEFMYALTLTLISIPYNQVDPRAEWDECVTLVLNKFIEILKANPSLSPEEPPCHHSILIYGVLARCISRRRLSSLVAHMETLSDKFNFPHHQFKVHQSLIQMYNFTKNFEKSISYFNLILPQVDITMLGSVSNAYAALGKPNSVLELMELGKKLGLMKDSKENFILNRNVIDAAVKQGGLDGALLYLNEHLLDLPPSMLGEILSRILYWGTLEAPFTHASLIFELAKSKGCSLTSAGMASLMSNYIASKFYDKALEIFFGFKYPSEHMYALALEAASKTLPSTFFELHDSAIAAHLNGFLKLSGTYFYPFIKLVYTMNGYDAALKSLQSMVSLGLSIPPNIQIQMLIWKHSSEIMEQPIEALSTYLKPFKTYRVTYILLIKDLLEKHHVIQAVDFLHFLLLENTTGKIFSIDANILSLYIDYFGQQKCPELLRILVALVKSLNKVTEKEPVFLSALLKAYSHMGQYEKAFEIWDGYVYSKKTPPLNMIASVLDTCGFAQDLRRLNEIVEFIVEKGYGVNINIWTSAIEAYLRLNHIQGVKKVFSKWIPSSGVQIDDKCLGTLLSMSKDTELDEELLQVVRHYFHEHPDTTIKKWYSLDSLSYSPSIHSFYKFSEKHSFKKPNSLEIINN
ncbi:hypothetical protein HMI55_002236 [Coelomomyces lativittatus]|nr:hypothetical protein HMI55_002236 [Coelomomyces lativittatus]